MHWACSIRDEAACHCAVVPLHEVTVAAALDCVQVALIGDAMELDGFITEGQFRDIVEVAKFFY